MSGPLLEQMEQMQEDMFGNYRKEKKTPKKIFFCLEKSHTPIKRGLPKKFTVYTTNIIGIILYN